MHVILTTAYKQHYYIINTMKLQNFIFAVIFFMLSYLPSFAIPPHIWVSVRNQFYKQFPGNKCQTKNETPVKKMLFPICNTLSNFPLVPNKKVWVWKQRTSFYLKLTKNGDHQQMLNSEVKTKVNSTGIQNPGANPTKHDFANFKHICKIFSQICVKFLANLWKMNPT
jgi:hypothetical protein